MRLGRWWFSFFFSERRYGKLFKNNKKHRKENYNNRKKLEVDEGVKKSHKNWSGTELFLRDLFKDRIKHQRST